MRTMKGEGAGQVQGADGPQEMGWVCSGHGQVSWLFCTERKATEGCETEQ